jgi:hypothetical protein
LYLFALCGLVPFVCVLAGSVPSLGGSSTSDSDVAAFYDYWLVFSSCRVFADADGAATQQQQRDAEKRQYAARQRDTQRVRQLAQAAYNKDPRVARIKRQAEEESNAKFSRRQAQQAAKEGQY